jgi:hypothetical protein
MTRTLARSQGPSLPTVVVGAVALVAIGALVLVHAQAIATSQDRTTPTSLAFAVLAALAAIAIASIGRLVALRVSGRPGARLSVWILPVAFVLQLAIALPAIAGADLFSPPADPAAAFRIRAPFTLQEIEASEEHRLRAQVLPNFDGLGMRDVALREVHQDESDLGVIAVGVSDLAPGEIAGYLDGLDASMKSAGAATTRATLGELPVVLGIQGRTTSAIWVEGRLIHYLLTSDIGSAGSIAEALILAR